ncbi:hypothetical protein [Pararhizobium sp. DWP3-4]|uniref:hypothetical protein n=1 Tax=Pararhizobium sp. DWP3-4 TaxID=2804565 RepID=UPI003CE9CA30
MPSFVEPDVVRAAIHRTLYVHFNKRPEVTFDLKMVRSLIVGEGVAVTDDIAWEKLFSVLILEMIEDHIILLCRNGASHTFVRVEMPGAEPAWKYSETPTAVP